MHGFASVAARRLRRSVGLFLVAGVLAGFTPYRFQEIFHANAAAVVRLRVSNHGQERFFSAFLVGDDGTLVAPAASAQAADAVHIVDRQGRAVAAEVLLVDPGLGVAVLRAPSGGALPTVKIGLGHQLQDGEWVVGISHNDAGEAEAVAGCVSELQRDGHGTQDGAFVIDAATAPGGPVLNLAGEVVAVAIKRKGARRAVAVRIDEVTRLLLRARERDAAARPAARTPQPALPPGSEKERS